MGGREREREREHMHVKLACAWRSGKDPLEALGELGIGPQKMDGYALALVAGHAVGHSFPQG